MHAASNHTRLASLRAAAAFTLTEMLVAIGVLVVVIVAAAKIFGASSKVASVAEANADLLQTANAIEAQIRADFANLPPNGFLVLQQVEVNQPGQLQTLDPSLGGAEIRADQVAFFTRGIRPTQQYVGSQNLIPSGGVIAADWAAEAAVARVYYGHGVTAPTLPVGRDPTFYGVQPPPVGAQWEGAPMVPWQAGVVETRQWDSVGGTTGTARVPVTKPSNWPLVRMATLMTTDGATTAQFATGTGLNATQRLFAGTPPLTVHAGPLTTIPSATPVPDPRWTSSRVDICKWQMDDLLTQMCYQYNGNFTDSEKLPFTRSTNFHSQPSTRLRMLQTLSPWAIPATRLAAGDGTNFRFVGYPRVEKSALGPARNEQMLTAPVLAANCSSFKVEWTWTSGVGRSWFGYDDPTTPITGDEPIGMYVRPNSAQPWFGLDSPADPNVGPISDANVFTNDGAFKPWGAIGLPLVAGAGSDTVLCAVEGPRTGGSPIWTTSTRQGAKRVYSAVFGFNQTDPSETAIDAPNRGPYTPLPSALRITIRLHDSLGRIEGGRDFQFIVELPKS
jgi:type II secretory pathway pseudopilin PulG